ncbi:hypothetical protein G7078_08175 [Sphingomonas sinipercae]|uniref:Uncharacterized protein n=1 Tax=Sphingomonas sinipercae TaxID=2714944 RepID=A0A6G7ZPB2_9SPHN|nr:YdbH domain-containing protein [Sphingomonas sinipercae]QIL02759.1 hypothetical protein G7078_08175 [Sphingomonas sinipercae]
MDEFRGESGEPGEADVVIVRRHRLRRLLTWVALGLLALLLVALVFVWVERRTIAGNVIDNELEKRGVRGSYTLDRVGLRTQQISNLVLGDPKSPDVVAKRVLVQMRIKWNGGIDVYRIVARGVRLRGTVGKNGQVSWGELDKLLPAPSKEKKPFALPDVAVDIADTSISLRTPWGPLGFALAGSGNLTGGFEGKYVASVPKLVTGRCTAQNVRSFGSVEVTARRPHVDGPLSADFFTCPASRFSVVKPRLEIDSRFSESFNRYDARARILSQMITAGDNGLAALNGMITLNGAPDKASGRIDISAQKSRLGTIGADRTRVTGKYRLGVDTGTLVMAGHYTATGATMAPSMIASFTNALSATRGTPIGAIAGKMSDAISKSARSFDASGGLALVNFPGGGGARIVDANVRTATGARARISGGKGLTYYWPSGAIRVDGRIDMRGGGLPEGTMVLRQRKDGGMDGVGNFRPYISDGSRLALSTVRFSAQGNGATTFSTVATLDGRFPGGVVRGLSLPIAGSMGSAGGIQVGKQCTVISFDALRMQALTLDRTRLPVCPTGPAIIYQPPGGQLRVSGRIANPAITGRIGSSPMRLNASSILMTQQGFNGSNVALRLGKTRAPVMIDAATLRGNFTSGGARGTIGGADAVIGEVPLKLTDMDGRWHFANGRLVIDGSTLVSDRADPPRFYPLRSNDVHFVLADNRITTTGSLRHPASGALVTNVDIRHNLETGAGGAGLNVPGISFNPNGLQPNDLTRLTEGVVALVNGTLSGRGDINWSGSGAVTSTAEFWTRGMDLAAPFGPVTGLSTNIRFTDLLGLETAPGQVATVASINPGIEVTNGTIRYQLLPDQLVKVERGEWPFMGGRLILQETILNFGAPTAKRLTFQVEGLNAKTFIDTLGFEGLEITGIFDGVLPMIFDEEGGRIVGGRLDARPPGGQFRYTGTKPKAGLVAGLAFDLLSDIRYRSMIIRLDGDLAGEFATRMSIDQITLANRGGFLAGLVRGAFRKVPLKVNLNVQGPFRALIQMAKGMKDPTQVIAPVLPFPVDSPSLDVVVLRNQKDEEQTPQTQTNVIERTPNPPAEGETK